VESVTAGNHACSPNFVVNVNDYIGLVAFPTEYKVTVQLCL